MHSYQDLLVDHNSECAGFHGGSLLRQANFLLESIGMILRLYEHYQIPAKDIIVVGHSMGGVVARQAMSLPTYQPKTIKTLITLSSPHFAPVITVDPNLVKAYRMMNQFWMKENNPKLKDSVFINFPPTPRDRQVSSLKGFTGNIKSHLLSIDLGTFAICPDHNSSLYCQELLDFIVEMILKFGDDATPLEKIEIAKQLTEERSAHMIQEHLGMKKVDQVRQDYLDTLWYEKIDRPLVKATVVHSSFTVGLWNGISTSIGFPSKKPYSVILFEKIKLGWRYYRLKVTSMKQCKELTIRATKLNGSRHQWFFNKCEMLIGFENDNTSGMQLEIWTQQHDPPLEVEISLDVGTLLTRIASRQFQRIVTAMILFSLLVLLSVWRVELKNDEIGRYLLATMLSPSSYMVTLSGPLASILWANILTTQRQQEDIPELIISALLGIAGLSIFVVICILLISAGERVSSKKSSESTFQLLATGAGMNGLKAWEIICIILIGIILPSSIILCGSLIAFIIALFRSSHLESIDRQWLQCLLPFLLLGGVIESPLLFVDISEWKSWYLLRSANPLLSLPCLAITVSFIRGSFNRGTLHSLPDALKRYLIFSWGVLFVGTSIFGDQGLYWPIITCYLLAIPIIAYCAIITQFQN